MSHNICDNILVLFALFFFQNTLAVSLYIDVVLTLSTMISKAENTSGIYNDISQGSNIWRCSYVPFSSFIASRTVKFRQTLNADINVETLHAVQSNIC